ncbi:M23 family metallopeptidase [Streptomyces albus]|uniref:M23 family metallopeptidase n=1 Tax=Streptomyces albus TaxID=1888 RepID=UPI0037A64F6D
MVNDRHPSGVPSPDDSGSGFSPDAYAAYGGGYGQPAYGAYGEEAYSPAAPGEYPADAYGTPDGTYAAHGNTDPLYGSLPGTDTGGYPATAAWEATATWDTADYAQQAAAQNIPAQQQPGQADFGYSAADDGTAQWTFGVAEGMQESAAWDSSSWGNGGWDTAATQEWSTAGWDTASWENGSQGVGAAYGYEHQDTHADHAAHTAQASPHLPGAHQAQEDYEGYAAYEQAGYNGYEQPGGYAAQPGTQDFGTQDFGGFDPAGPVQGEAPAHDQEYERRRELAEETTAQWDFSALSQEDDLHGQGYGPETTGDAQNTPNARNSGNPENAEDAAPDAYGSDSLDADGPVTVGAVGGPHARGRRRSPKPRSRRRALMTVAVPSVAVMGVAGAAAANVLSSDDSSKDSNTTTVAAPDAAPVKPSNANSKLDTQLASLSADADDFADRASRTQERIDLKERQQAEKERKAREAARKEAMRPKFVLPVKDHTLSARYGQAGVNWMSVHTGIDFPVSYGTPVSAATDGTVTTKYDVSYGNMAIVTAKDGTQTWYCHLSSNKIRSGSVKAGDVIAYSGSSGNSTGPHLHFEVRPGGGSAVDPIPWLQSKGLNIS